MTDAISLANPHTGAHRWRRTIVAVAAAIMLGGCSVGQSALDLIRFEDPPLPGERISVLSDQAALTADPQIAGQQVTLPAPVVEFDWPQQGGSSAHTMSHAALSDSPREIWSQDIGDGTDSDEVLLSGPVLANGIIYTIDTEAEVRAYDAATGQLVWDAELERREERDGSWGGGLAIGEGLLIVTTGFAEVIALDAATGALVWNTKVDGPMRSSPTIDQGKIFAIARNDKLFVLDLRTGELLWEHSGRNTAAGLIGGSSPAIFGDIVFVPYSSGEFYALSIRDGTDFWFDSLVSGRQTASASTISDIRARPVIFDRNVYVSSHAGRLAAYVLATSEQLWELNIGTLAQPWAVGDYLFVTTMNGEVAAIKSDSGLVRWVTRIGEFKNERRRKGRIIWSGPVLAGDRLIVVGSNGEVLSLSPYTGELLSRLKIRGGATLSPIVAQETMYLLTDRGKLIAYR